MTDLLHEAYAALLSGLTTRNENGIKWEDEDGDPITIIPIDINSVRYKIIGWYKSGYKRYEIDYINNQRHGRAIWWFESGTKAWEAYYVNGIRQ